MVVEWCPQPNGINAETGDHGCSKLACGHFTCVLMDKRDGCSSCEELRMKADSDRRALIVCSALSRISSARCGPGSYSLMQVTEEDHVFYPDTESETDVNSDDRFEDAASEKHAISADEAFARTVERRLQGEQSGVYIHNVDRAADPPTQAFLAIAKSASKTYGAVDKTHPLLVLNYTVWRTVWDSQTGALLQMLDVPSILTAAFAH